MKTINADPGKRNVLIFDAAYPPPVVGGKEKQAHLLAVEMKSQGLGVCALSYLHNGNHTQVHDGIQIYRVKKDILAPLNFLIQLMKLRRKYNILHIHTPSRVGHLLVFLGFLLGYRIVFKFPGQNLLKDLSPLAKWYWGTTIQLANLLVVLEGKTQNTLVSTWNVDQGKVFLAANGVEIQPIKTYHSRKALRLLFVGRLVRVKGCSVLLDACGKLEKNSLEWNLDVVGDGPMLASLQHKAKELNISHKTNFHGYQSDVLKYMREVDLLVLPSESEGMSNVLLEAMAVGLPVICTDVGAARKLLGKQGEDYLIEPFDIIGLSNKISLFVEDRTLLKEFGTYLHDRCHANFSIQAIANNYIEHYQKLEVQ